METISDKIKEKLYKRGIVPGSVLKFKSYSEYTLPDYKNWTIDDYNGDEIYWLRDKGAPHEHCWITSRYCSESIKVISTPEDNNDTIRVGDVVERVKEELLGLMAIGDQGVVTHIHIGKSIFDNSPEKMISLDKYDGNYYLKYFKKVKANRPVSVNKQPISNEQLSITFTGTGLERGEGQAIRTNGFKSKIAMGVRHSGNQVKARTGSGRLGKCQVLIHPIRSSHI